MNLRSLVFLTVSLLPLAAHAQEATAPPPSAAAAKTGTPDYPDPRTFTFGVFYWINIPGSGPNLNEGKAGTTPGALNGMGGAHKSPEIEASLPITRTGVIHVELFETKGDGNGTLPADAGLFSTGYNKGDLISSQYQIEAGKIYLEDLLHPFKFPVARFRLMSLWELQYIGIKNTLDAPKKATTDASGNAVNNTATGSRYILFPTFGLAAVYDLAPHLTFRAAASGFGLPQRADIWDAEATIAYRHNKLEVVGGYKAMHFKTSPKKDEYLSDTLNGAFVGLRWHF